MKYDEIPLPPNTMKDWGGSFKNLLYDKARNIPV